MVSEAVRRQLHDGDHVVQVPRFELRVDLVHIPGPEGTGAAVDEAEVGAPAVPQRGRPSPPEFQLRFAQVWPRATEVSFLARRLSPTSQVIEAAWRRPLRTLR